MSLERIKAEITADPIGLGYSGKTPAQILAILLTRNRPRTRTVSSADLLSWSAGAQRFTKIEDAAVNHVQAAPKNVAKVLLRFLQPSAVALKISDWTAGIDALVGATPVVLTGADKTALLALGTDLINRFQELDIPETHVEGIQKAMSLP